MSGDSLRRNSENRLPVVSALENRQLLAGNVQASFANFTVTMTGDRAKNDIQLFTDGSGLHVVAQNGTSLNGVLNGSLVFGTFDQVVVDLQAGNDALSVGNFAGGGITVQMGTGNDFAAFSAVTGDSLVVDGGTGNDFISLDDDNGVNTFSGFVTLLGSDGNDTVQNIGTTMQGNFNLSGGKGNDNLGWAGGGATSFSHVTSGTGNDKIALTGVNVPSGFTFLDEAGNDLIGIQNSVFGSTATFSLGSGNDALIAEGNTYNIVDRQGGSGRDTLFLTGETVSGNNQSLEFEVFPNSVVDLVQKLTIVLPFFV